MTTPTYSEVLTQINTYIVANGNNEITANVLNPILELILDFANNTIGNLDDLTTDEKENIVAAINSLKQNIQEINTNSVQLYTGVDNPNTTPPASFTYADFYMQLDFTTSEPIKLWQFNGFEWGDYPEVPSTQSDNVQNNSNVTGSSVTDALNTLLTNSAVPEHNSLNGLQGGVSGEYNHLTNTQVSLVNGSEQAFNKQNSLDVDGTGQKYSTVDAVRMHTTNTSNPHSVTKSQVGLSNVDNTSDLNKPISTATQTALNVKANTSDLSQILTFETRWNTGDSQTFTLPDDAFSIISVTVQGVSKSEDYYSIPTANTVTILDTIYDGNFIQIIYATNSSSNLSPYYTQSQVDFLIQQKIADAKFGGSITTTSTPTITGSAYWITTQAGTYTNFGGVVVPVNSLAIISRVDNVWSISSTSFSLESYVSKDDNINSNIISYNTNNKWIKGLLMGDRASIQPFTFISQQGGFVYDTQPYLTPIHNFDYKGDALGFKVVTASTIQRTMITIPTGTNINDGDKFKVLIQVEIIEGDSWGTSIIQVLNSSLSPVGASSRNLITNNVVLYEIECIANTTSDRYHVSFSVGQKPWKGSLVKVGQVVLTKGFSAKLNPVNTEVEADFRARGIIVDQGLAPRNLLDINSQEVEPSVRFSTVVSRPPLNIFYNHSNPVPSASQTSLNTVVVHVDSEILMIGDNNLIYEQYYGITPPEGILLSKRFDYVGNVMKLKLPNNGNHFFYHLIKISELNEIPVGEKVYLNFEACASAPVSFTLAATKQTGVSVGSNLGTIVLNTTVQKFSLEIDVALMGVDSGGARLIFASNYFGTNVYFGRMVVSDIKTDSIELVPTVRIYPVPVKSKIVSTGDSKVEQQSTLPQHCIQTGNYYSTQEIDYGNYGFLRTAMGGQRIIPTDGNATSIYNLSKDAGKYSGDIHLIYGGANDPRSEFITDGTWLLILGNEKDTPYDGDGTELDFSGYRAYWQSVLANSGNRNPSSPYDVTFSSCYQGIINNILTIKPTAIIKLQTEMIWSGGEAYQRNVWQPMNELIRKIGLYYNCEIIDVAKNGNINIFNAANYMDGILVHETISGGLRMLKEFRDKLKH